ncbi:MAG: substrate-binding domain-containing protein [Aquincola sp.]|nr:substrate-binding domain-containing protein [Aquincola sp.]
MDERLCVHADLSADSGYRAAQRLLAAGAPFTALFAGNDTIAFGVLQALREAGRRVPDDVALVGYDDIPLAPFACPPLTSVRSDPVGHGRKAVEMLLAQLQGRGLDGIAPLPPAELVVRASCGAQPLPLHPAQQQA